VGVPSISPLLMVSEAGACAKYSVQVK